MKMSGRNKSNTNKRPVFAAAPGGNVVDESKIFVGAKFTGAVAVRVNERSSRAPLVSVALTEMV